MKTPLKFRVFSLSLAFLFFSGLAAATESDPFAYNEIKATLASEKNLIHYNRVSGMICDLLREQKRLFALQGNGDDGPASRVEELLNEAGLFASEDKYTDAFQVLETAHETVMQYLRQMNGNP